MAKNSERYTNFVSHILKKKSEDKGYAAKLRRADNPNTEYYALGILASCGVQIDREEERMPFALIGAALCRSHFETDGSLELGEALRQVEGSEDDKDNMRLRRFLACSSVREMCRVLRPLLQYINSKNVNINHSTLLQQLCSCVFPESMQRFKLRITKQFYEKVVKDDKDESGIKEKGGD